MWFRNIIKNKKIKKYQLKRNTKYILNFIKENDINIWSEYEGLSNVDKQIIDDYINNISKSKNEFVYYKNELKLNLYNSEELKKWLTVEKMKENYELCNKINKKIKENKRK